MRVCQFHHEGMEEAVGFEPTQDITAPSQFSRLIS